MKKEETRMKNDGGEAPLLPNKGLYAYRKDGEKHAWNPETISTLQIATRLGSYKKFKEFTRLVDEKEKLSSARLSRLPSQPHFHRQGGTGGKHSETFRYGRHVFRSHQSGSA